LLAESPSMIRNLLRRWLSNQIKVTGSSERSPNQQATPPNPQTHHTNTISRAYAGTFHQQHPPISPTPLLKLSNFIPNLPQLTHQAAS